MAVDRQIYTATATWTAADLADIFEQAFIDADLMTSWYDSFLSGSVENRILEVTYNVQSFGKTYLWFKFTTTYAAVSICSGWNAGGNAPSGTALVDYTNTTTNDIASHRTLITLSPSVTTTLTRYTSSTNPDHSWFLLRNSTNSIDFHIEKGANVASFVDTDKAIAVPIIFSDLNVGTQETFCRFRLPVFAMRRNYFQINSTYSYSNSDSGITDGFLYSFTSRNATPVFVNMSGIVLPVARTAANPAYTADRVPLFTGLQLTPYSNTTLPADFALMPHWADNTMDLQDRMIVTAGVEEWEIIDRVNGDSGGGSRCSALLVARVV